MVWFLRRLSVANEEVSGSREDHDDEIRSKLERVWEDADEG